MDIAVEDSDSSDSAEAAITYERNRPRYSDSSSRTSSGEIDLKLTFSRIKRRRDCDSSSKTSSDESDCRHNSTSSSNSLISNENARHNRRETWPRIHENFGENERVAEWVRDLPEGQTGTGDQEDSSHEQQNLQEDKLSQTINVNDEVVQRALSVNDGEN